MCSRVHAVAIPVPGCRPIPDLQQDLKALGLVDVEAGHILNVIDGYLGEGYGIADRQLKGVYTCMHVYIHVHVHVCVISLLYSVCEYR